MQSHLQDHLGPKSCLLFINSLYVDFESMSRFVVSYLISFYIRCHSVKMFVIYIVYIHCALLIENDQMQV